APRVDHNGHTTNATLAELAHTRELLAETRRRLDDLAATVDDQRRRLEAAETERGELRRLLAAALSRVPELPPASTSTGIPAEASPPARPPVTDSARAPWWRRLLGGAP